MTSQVQIKREVKDGQANPVRRLEGFLVHHQSEYSIFTRLSAILVLSVQALRVRRRASGHFAQGSKQAGPAKGGRDLLVRLICDVDFQYHLQKHKKNPRVWQGEKEGCASHGIFARSRSQDFVAECGMKASFPLCLQRRSFTASSMLSLVNRKTVF